MAAISTIIGAVGLGLAAAGTVTQMIASGEQAAASRRQEGLRRRQMDLETGRQRRGVIRQALRARSMALIAGSEQGASSGSGLAGGLGQIGSQAAGSVQGINQANEIGVGMFQTNQQITGAQELASFGGGLSSLGGSLMGNSETLGKLGQYFTRTG
jgi:hypothetical protein